MSDERDWLPSLPKGFRARTLVTAKLAAKLGAAALRNELGLKPKEVSEEQAEKDAEELVEQLGKLKGLAMKFGQMASYLPGSMSPAAQRVLSKLQDSTPPMAPVIIERVLREELGSGPNEVFEEFDHTPFAAASIGQVHHAKHQGKAVAVKVQYPNIEEVIRGDLKLASRMISMMSMGSAVDSSANSDELTTRLLEECDYLREARNTKTFKKLIETEPSRVAPKVIDERSSRRVLTTEKIPGKSFRDFLPTATQAEKDKAGYIIYDTCFRLLFEHALFNADPHPGNYLFLENGHVAFLDFGCARSFELSMIETWKGFARSVVSGDRKGFRDGFIAMGFAKENDKKFDWDAQWTATQFLYKPFLVKNYRFEHSYISESYDILMFKNPNRMRLAMPREWLFLNRLQWGLFAVLNELEAQGPWSDLWREYINGKTTPVTLE